jgi:hypothetical protein
MLNGRFAAPAFALSALVTAPGWIVVNDAIGQRAFYLIIDGQDVAVLALLTVAIAFLISLALGADATSLARRIAGGGGVAMTIGMAAFAVIAMERTTDAAQWAAFDALQGLYVLTLLLSLGLLAPARTPRLARLALGFLAAISPFCLVFALIAGRALVALPWTEVSRMPAAVSVGTPHGGRVVFVLFDELDADFVFGASRGRLALDAFDRLRGESRWFDRAEPSVEASTTHLAVPTLLTGRPVATFDPVGRSDASMKFADSRTSRWATTRTELDAATAAGLRVGIVGWYFPYCRFGFGVAARECVWQSITPFRPFSTASFHLGQSGLEWGKRLAPYARRSAHITMVRQLGEAGIRIASDPSIDIAFIHVPLPHSPYFYSATSHSYGLHMTTYPDNVVAANDFMGELRQRMERAGVWDSTTLVVTSDHPYRGGHGTGPLGHGAGMFIPLVLRVPGGGQVAGHCVSREQTGSLLATVVKAAHSSDAQATALDQWASASPGTPCSAK